MSDQPQEGGNDPASQPKTKDPPKEEEDDGYTCTKCWYGYCACVVWCCKCTYNTIIAVKNAIATCCAACWYPMKERCCNCCDRCDRDLHPYKDPYHNPYDTI